MAETLQDFIMNTTQLVNTGRVYSIRIFYTSNHKTICGKLVGVRLIDSNVIDYTILDKRDRFVCSTHVYLNEIDGLTQITYYIKNFLLENTWDAAGKRCNKLD